MRPKKICVFTVRRPSLIFGPDPKLFYCTFIILIPYFCLPAYSPVKCEIPKNTRPRHLKFFVPNIFLSPTVFDRYERVFNRAKGYKLYRLIFCKIFVSEYVILGKISMSDAHIDYG